MTRNPAAPSGSNVQERAVSEKLAQEFSRLVGEYNDDDAGDATKAEAWNYIADFAVENSHEIASALAALAPQQAAPMPGVKALEWEQPDGEAATETSCWLGHGTDWCQYYIGFENGSWWHPFDNKEDPEGFDTLDAAKAACQADYERRILSALATPEAGTSEPVAVACDEDNMPERIWAGDFDGQGFGHCVAGMQRGLYSE
jgi:hypothetical protein